MGSQGAPAGFGGLDQAMSGRRGVIREDLCPPVDMGAAEVLLQNWRITEEDVKLCSRPN